MLRADLLDPPTGKHFSGNPSARDRLSGSAEVHAFTPIGLRAFTSVVVFVVAFLLRFIRVQQAYDIFIDEITYSRIAESVASRHSVAFFGVPFFLHPPVVFYEMAFFIDMFHIHGNIFAVVYALRSVNVLFASGSAVFMLRLATRVGGTVAGVVAAGVFAIDPFLIRFDGRAFLEPGTLLWVLGGYCLFVSGVQYGGSLHSFFYLGAAGLAMGLGVLSNEMALPLVAGPLIVGVLLSWPLPRKLCLITSVALVAVLSSYLLTVVLSGELHQFVDQQFLGVQRLIGTEQLTGFNRAGAPSFLSRIDAHIANYGGVYAVIAIAVIPMVWLLLKGQQLERLVALVGLSAYALLAYQVGFGTLEEQMFYYGDVPAILLIAVGLSKLVGQYPLLRRGLLAYYAAVLVISTTVVVDGISWVQVHTTRDNAMQSAISWLYNRVPSGTRIAPLVDTSQLLVNSYQVFMTETPPEVRRYQPAYVLTSSLQVSQGYGYASKGLVRWLGFHAKRDAQFQGRTFGTITVWRLPYAVAPGAPPGFAAIGASLPSQPVGQGG